MVFTKKSLFAGSIVFFTALGILLSTQPSWYLQNAYLTGLIGSLVYILLPIFLVYFKSIPFIQLKTAHWEYNAIYNWSIGSVIIFLIYTLFYLLFKTPLEVFFYIILSISIAYDGLRLFKKDTLFDEIITVPKFTKKSAIFVGLFACALVYYYLLYWRNWAPAYTQLTDLLNHNTVANSILQGRFAWFPSQLTDSIQLDSYLTVFHLQLAMARLFFSAFNLFEFQFVMQFVLLGFTFKLFQTFLSLFSKYWWVVILTALLVIIPNAPTLSFIRYAVVPNEVVFLLAPVVIYLLAFHEFKSKKEKNITLLLLLLISFSFHFISTILILPAIIIFNSKPFFEKRLVISFVQYFIIITSLFLVLNAAFFKINIAYIILQILGALGLTSDTFKALSNQPIWIHMRYYALYLSPVVFSLIYAIIILFFKKIPVKFLYITIPAAIYFLISQISLPFADRLSSLILIFLAPLIVIFLNKFDSIKSTVSIVLLLCFMITTILFSYIRKVDDYPPYQFWTKENADLIQLVEQDIQINHINPSKIYTLAEPMTKMQAQSMLQTQGGGSYMSTDERDNIYKSIKNQQLYCGENNAFEYSLLIINARFFQWYNNPNSYKSNVDNVWFDYGTDVQSQQNITQFDINWFEANIISSYQTHQGKIAILQCE